MKMQHMFTIAALCVTALISAADGTEEIFFPSREIFILNNTQKKMELLLTLGTQEHGLDFCLLPGSSYARSSLSDKLRIVGTLGEPGENNSFDTTVDLKPAEVGIILSSSKFLVYPLKLFSGAGEQVQSLPLYLVKSKLSCDKTHEKISYINKTTASVEL